MIKNITIFGLSTPTTEQRILSHVFSCIAIICLLFSNNSFSLSNAEMEFKTVEVCDFLQNCNISLVADGVISSKTASAFLKAVESNARPLTLYINGKGNDLQAGIALGKAIRSKRFDTQAGLVTQSPEKIGQTLKHYLKDGGECISACLLAFLGGQSRISRPGDILGFYKLSTTADDANEKKVRASAAEYISNLGVNTNMLDYLSFGNGDQVQRIPFATVKKLNIDNYDAAPESPWHIKATAGGQVIAVISEKDKKSQFSVTLALTKPAANDATNTGNLRLIIFIKPIKNALTASEFTIISNTNSVVSIYANNFSITDLSAKKWERYQEGIQSFVSLPIQSVEKIAEARFFDLSLPLPETYTASPTMRFGTEGLKSAIAALKK